MEYIKRLYREFQKTGGTHASYLAFLWYMFLRMRYATSINDYFKYGLYRVFENHSDYYHKTTRYKRSWKVAAKDYIPDSTAFQKVCYFLDFMFSRLLYPGLDAADYLGYAFYGIRRAKRKTFITEGELARMNRRFNGSSAKSPLARKEKAILDQKDQFNTVFSDMIGRNWMNFTPETGFEELLTFCMENQEVIIKPVDGVQGRGIEKICVRSEKDVRELYDSIKGLHYCIEQVLHQHPELEKFNPSSVNTIRVYSVESQGEIYITGAIFRIGREGSTTDNYSSGGVASEIDVDSGIVISQIIDHHGNAFYIHPDSQQVVIGFRIPRWQEITEHVKTAHKRFATLRYIGWDAAVTENGEIALIEANTSAGVEIQQLPSLKGKKPIYQPFLN